MAETPFPTEFFKTLRRMTLHSHDDLKHFDESLSVHSNMLPLLIDKLSMPVKTWTQVLDAGCGFGATTLALGRTLPQKVKIWGNSVDDTPVDSVRSELANRLEVVNGYLMDLLRQTSEKFNLVYLAEVGYTELDTGNDCKVLYDRVEDYGYVIAQGDTRLSLKHMDEYFQKIEVPKGITMLTNPHIWQKIPAST